MVELAYLDELLEVGADTPEEHGFRGFFTAGNL